MVFFHGSPLRSSGVSVRQRAAARDARPAWARSRSLPVTFFIVLSIVKTAHSLVAYVSSTVGGTARRVGDVVPCGPLALTCM